jgi:hypothetical protein
MLDFLNSIEGLDINLKRKGDGIALIFHAYMLSINFRLVGIADEKLVSEGWRPFWLVEILLNARR